jgi:hypothetical protein
LDIIILALIVLGAIILFIATRFVGKVIGLTVKILLLIILVLVILTIVVYKDADSLRKGFAEENNTFFLYENNKLYTAVTMRPMTSINLSIDSFKYFTKEEISQSESELNNKNYAALLSNNYRIFLFKPVVINKPYNLSLLVELNEGDLLNIIMSDDPFLVLAEKTQEEYNLTAEDLKAGFKDIYSSEEKFKGYLFAALLSNYFQKQGPGELTTNIKNKKIQVYPESISFKIIKYLPWV